MFNKRLRERLLIVFSDPGGAKPCLSIADALDPDRVRILTDRAYSFYSDFQSNVTLINSDSEIENYIRDFKPKIVLTGTSYTSDIEKFALKMAKNMGISTISFVDHWTSISSRFRDNSDELILPDEVWVLDERAKQIAIDEGIEEGKIFISGNPYHIWLKDWNPSILKKEFFSNLGLDDKKKYVLFAPDPLSNINGIKRYGFDEYIASRRMVECIEESSTDFKSSYHFLIKMHPNQLVDKLIKVFDGLDNFTILPIGIDTNQSIYFSSLVVGFFSSLLIEAKVMNKPVIRFLEHKLTTDPFLGLNLGTTSNGSDFVNNILRYTK